MPCPCIYPFHCLEHPFRNMITSCILRALFIFYFPVFRRYILVFFYPFFNIDFFSYTFTGFLAPNQAGITQVWIKINLPAIRTFYFYIILPELNFFSTIDTFIYFDVFWFEISRIHAGTLMHSHFNTPFFSEKILNQRFSTSHLHRVLDAPDFASFAISSGFRELSEIAFAQTRSALCYSFISPCNPITIFLTARSFPDFSTASWTI